MNRYISMMVWLQQVNCCNFFNWYILISYNADIVSGSYSCAHKATYSFFSLITGNTIEYVKETKPSAYYITNNGDGIAYTVNLFDSRSNMLAVQASGAGVTNYKNEKITIKFTCNVENVKITIRR